jgi:hypothetical protein
MMMISVMYLNREVNGAKMVMHSDAYQPHKSQRISGTAKIRG